MKDYTIKVKGIYGWALEETCINEQQANKRLVELQKQNPNKEYRVEVVVDGWWHDEKLVK